MESISTFLLRGGFGGPVDDDGNPWGVAVKIKLKEFPKCDKLEGRGNVAVARVPLCSDLGKITQSFSSGQRCCVFSYRNFSHLFFHAPSHTKST